METATSTCESHRAREIQSSFRSFPSLFPLYSRLLAPESRAHRRRFKLPDSSNRLNPTYLPSRSFFLFFKGKKVLDDWAALGFIATADTLPDKGRHFRGSCLGWKCRMVENLLTRDPLPPRSRFPVILSAKSLIKPLLKPLSLPPPSVQFSMKHRNFQKRRYYYRISPKIYIRVFISTTLPQRGCIDFYLSLSIYIYVYIHAFYTTTTRLYLFKINFDFRSFPRRFIKKSGYRIFCSIKMQTFPIPCVRV